MRNCICWTPSAHHGHSHAAMPLLSQEAARVTSQACPQRTCAHVLSLQVLKLAIDIEAILQRRHGALAPASPSNKRSSQHLGFQCRCLVALAACLEVVQATAFLARSLARATRMCRRLSVRPTTLRRCKHVAQAQMLQQLRRRSRADQPACRLQPCHRGEKHADRHGVVDMCGCCVHVSPASELNLR